MLFERKDSVSHKVLESFMLYPDAFINPKGQQGLSANPSTKHYWNRDIFTFINSASDKTKSDTSSYRSHTVTKVGDTIYLNNGYMVFTGFVKDASDKRYQQGENDMAVSAGFRVYDASGVVRDINPLFILKDKKYLAFVEDTVQQMGLFARFANLNVITNDSATAEIMLKQTDPKDDLIVLKALVFPYINVLWLGVIIMVFGFFISLGNLLSRTGSVDTAAVK